MTMILSEIHFALSLVLCPALSLYQEAKSDKLTICPTFSEKHELILFFFAADC